LATLNFAADGAEGLSGHDGEAMAYSSSRRRHGQPREIERALARAVPAPATDGRTVTVWGQVFGNWGRSNSDGNAAALSRTTGGFFSGIDTTLASTNGDVWRLGVAGGYQHSAIDVGDRASSGGIDTNYVAVYGGIQRGPVGLRTGLAYGWHDIDISRTIAFPGFADAARANYDGHTVQLFGELGYGVGGNGFAVEPFASVAYVSVQTAGFVEAGGSAALAGMAASSDSTFSTVGLRTAAPLPWFRTVELTAKGSAGWRRAFGTITPNAQVAFSSNMVPFTVIGVPIARDAAALELGLDGRLSPNAELAVAYSGQLASHAADHGINANYRRRF
jgi:fibronectin-binding autotransporter adhesin